MDRIETLEKSLSDFNSDVRRKALFELKKFIDAGDVVRNSEQKHWLNLHIHTFHSFNYKNWSSSRIVFEGWKTGLQCIGTVDFDTLAGLEETLFAGNLLNMKVTGGFESRVFIEEYKDYVMNSPEEPGIYYLCGKGFKQTPSENSQEGQFFKRMKEVAQMRNKKVIEKLNEFLKEINLDYEKDVLPLTPSGNPTERHIILAYQAKSEGVLKERVDNFWAEILELDKSQVQTLRTETPQDFQGKLRTKLIKYGGPGYIPPEKKDFPKFDEVIEMTGNAGGIPVGTWLNGINEGEKKPEKLIEFLKSKGLKAVTIIPERNWNIKDTEEKRIKVKNLDEFMETCRKMNMPVICGTEMNKFGQPFVDDFTQPELSRYLPYFLKSAEYLI